MKLLIPQEKLKEGVGIVEKITTKSLTLPILNNVFISAENNFINLRTTNLEIGISWWALSKIEQQGQTTVPAKILSNFLNLLPNKPVSLSTKNFDLKIVCENYTTLIKGTNPEDFPPLPLSINGEMVSVNLKPFCLGLKQVVDIPSPSSVRPEISGIYFSLQKDVLKMVSTDSFRLAEKSIFGHYKINNECSLIIPQRTAKEIINIFGDKEGEIKIYFSPNQILFEYDSEELKHPLIQITSRLVDGEYPAYQEIIPKKCETQVTVSKNEFLNQLKMASLFSGRVNEIKLKIDDQQNRIELFSQDPDCGQHQSFLPCQVKGKKLEISFNHQFLIDGISNIKSSEIIFEFTGEEKPAVLRPVGDSTYLYVVMPIKAT